MGIKGKETPLALGGLVSCRGGAKDGKPNCFCLGKADLNKGLVTSVSRLKSSCKGAS